MTVIHFSDGFENILTGPLAPYSEPHLSSPWQMVNDAFRTQAISEARGWLKSVAKATKYPELLTPHERMAFLFDVIWQDDENGIKRVLKANCQAVVVPENATIADALETDAEIPCQYLRADFEPGNLGALFPEPIPHVHSNVKKMPRFPVSLSAAAPHIDFIELVLRNYDRPLWESWASKVWNERIGAATAVKDEDDKSVEDGLEHLRGAFKNNRLDLLLPTKGKGALRGVIELWKQKLIEEKVAMTPLQRDTSYDVVSY